MAVKIIIEIILGLILAGVSSAFWNCVKSPKILGKLLGDYNELKKFYHHLGKEKIEQGGKNFPDENAKPANNSLWFQTIIVSWIKASVSALDKTRNMLLVVILGILIGSYFLGYIFLFINLALFFITMFPKDKIYSSALANLFQDIHVLMTNVYKWNKVDHLECERFCNMEQPRILKNVYRVVTEE